MRMKPWPWWLTQLTLLLVHGSYGGSALISEGWLIFMYEASQQKILCVVITMQSSKCFSTCLLQEIALPPVSCWWVGSFGHFCDGRKGSNVVSLLWNILAFQQGSFCLSRLFIKWQMTRFGVSSLCISYYEYSSETSLCIAINFFWIFHEAKLLPNKLNSLKNDEIQMNVLTSGSLIAICETVEGPLSTFSTVWWALFISRTFNNAWNIEVQWGIISFLQQGKGTMCLPHRICKVQKMKWNK